jgi:serine/threonine protein kinase
VCTIYAVEEEDGLPVIAMEYLDGRPLSETAAEGLEGDCALRLAEQIASGLAAAHGQDVVHGDLKPANVIVTKEGAAKILDFGLARSQRPSNLPSVDASGERRQVSPSPVSKAVAEADRTVDHAGSSETGVIRGTPAYMAPEQAAGLPATPASDVFFFGLTLFEMLTGRRAISEQQLVKRLVEDPTLDVAPDIASQVDEADRALLTAMLACDAAERPAVADVARMLEARK